MAAAVVQCVLFQQMTTHLPHSPNSSRLFIQTTSWVRPNECTLAAMFYAAGMTGNTDGPGRAAYCSWLAKLTQHKNHYPKNVLSKIKLWPFELAPENGDRCVVSVHALQGLIGWLGGWWGRYVMTRKCFFRPLWAKKREEIEWARSSGSENSWVWRTF